MSQVSIIDITGAHPDIPTTFVTDDGSAIPIANVLEILAQTVPAASIPIYTTGSGNTVTINAQISQAIAASDATKIGLAAFDSAQFTVDANGFVSLAGGGGTFVSSIGVDAFTPPGTNPVVASGSGQITVTGAQVSAGSIGVPVIRTNSLAANTYTIEIQRSSASATTNSALNGVAHFDSANFSVDANGFVTISGSGLAETITGNTGGPLPPLAGNWDIFGSAVVAGTTPVATSGSASTLTVNVQTSQAIAGTNASNIGLAAFDSAQFTVDANGFVSIGGGTIATTYTADSGSATPAAGNLNVLGGPGVTTSATGSTVTINSVVFTDRAVSAAVTSDSGSFCTAAGVTLTLPSSPAQGELLHFVCTTSDTLILQAPADTTIRIGSLVSSSAGTATSTLIGDSLTLRYYAANSEWIATSVIGTWVVA